MSKSVPPSSESAEPKTKPNQVKMPPIVRRGRLDLTDAREKAGLKSPMSPEERTIFENRLDQSIQCLMSTEGLLKIKEESIMVTLAEIKKARKAVTEEQLKLQANKKEDTTKAQDNSHDVFKEDAH